MAKRRPTRLQKRKGKKNIRKTRSIRKTLKRKMTGGNYSEATFSGFKNKNAARVFYPGGSSTWAEYKTSEDLKLDD